MLRGVRNLETELEGIKKELESERKAFKEKNEANLTELNKLRNGAFFPFRLVSIYDHFNSLLYNLLRIRKPEKPNSSFK